MKRGIVLDLRERLAALEARRRSRSSANPPACVRPKSLCAALILACGSSPRWVPPLLSDDEAAELLADVVADPRAAAGDAALAALVRSGRHPREWTVEERGAVRPLIDRLAALLEQAVADKRRARWPGCQLIPARYRLDPERSPFLDPGRARDIHFGADRRKEELA